MYLQSLLRDQFFTIRTDHRNLLFITEASNSMIVRLYMALSEFSFSLEFRPGVDNDIADLVLIMISQILSLIYVVIESSKEYSPEYISSEIGRAHV